MWTLENARELIIQIEAFAPAYGAHVALTGGVLYKEGVRKDLDIMFYRIRQVPRIDEAGLIGALKGFGFDIIKKHGWVTKAKFNGLSVDLLFPDTPNTTTDWYAK